ncbi:MAG: hypothetical protein AAF417_21900 [Pseudomonadota bacterium]
MKKSLLFAILAGMSAPALAFDVSTIVGAVDFTIFIAALVSIGTIAAGFYVSRNGLEGVMGMVKRTK